MFEPIINLINDLVKTAGPVGLAIATFIESLCTPIPSEPILILAGTNIENTYQLLVYIIFATIGSYFGTLPFYLIGKKSRTFVMNFFAKYGKFLGITVKNIEKAEESFNKKGKIIIFSGRLIPTVRSLISIPAGIAKIDLKTYSIYTILGSTLWNTLLIGSGYLVGKDGREAIIGIFDKYEKLVIAIILLSGFAYLTYRIYKYIKKSK